MIRWVCRHDIGGANGAVIPWVIRWVYRALMRGNRAGWHGMDVFHFDPTGQIVGKFSYVTAKRPRLEPELGTPLRRATGTGLPRHAIGLGHQAIPKAARDGQGPNPPRIRPRHAHCSRELRGATMEVGMRGSERLRRAWGPRARDLVPLAMCAAAAVGMLALPAIADAQTAYEDLVPGQWFVVSRNTLKDMDPCPTRDCSYSAVEGVWAVINDWTGAAFATGYGTHGGLVAFGGGHNGYFGSEIYVFDVGRQEWDRVTDPYDDGSGSVAPACNSDGIYPDGSPCPQHTYDQVDYHPDSNSFVLLVGTTDPVCGGCVDSRAHLYSFTTGEWSLGAYKSINVSYGGASAYDESRDLFWLLSGYTHAFSSYDPNDDAWTERGAPWPGNNGIDGAAVVDPERDLFLFIDARATERLYAMPLAGPYDTLIELTTVGDTEIQGRPKLGFERDPVSGRFLGWHDGADVYVLTPPEGDWRTEPWLWARVPPDPGNAVVPSSNSNGTYSRLQYAPSINAFLLLNEADGPVLAYRLSPGAGTGPNPIGPDPTPTADGGTPSPDAGGTPSPDAGGVPTGDSGVVRLDPEGEGTRSLAGSGGCTAAPGDRPASGLAFLLCLVLTARRRRNRAVGG